jgi:hypothetical protein
LSEFPGRRPEKSDAKNLMRLKKRNGFWIEVARDDPRANNLAAFRRDRNSTST